MNKVNTKADIRMNVDMAAWLPEDMKEALKQAVSTMHCCQFPHSHHAHSSSDAKSPERVAQEGNRFNKEGEIVVTSTRTRSQACVIIPLILFWSGSLAYPTARHKHLIRMLCLCNRDNVEDAIHKLQEMIDAAALAVQPIEEDPVKKKKLAKQCAAASCIGEVFITITFDTRHRATVCLRRCHTESSEALGYTTWL